MIMFFIIWLAIGFYFISAIWASKIVIFEDQIQISKQKILISEIYEIEIGAEEIKIRVRNTKKDIELMAKQFKLTNWLKLAENIEQLKLKYVLPNQSTVIPEQTEIDNPSASKI